MWSDQLLSSVMRIAVAAGAEILSVYHSADGVEVSYKDDSSPLTEADRRAHNLIVTQLEELTPDIPVLSEESEAIGYDIRSSWSRYWLVDPLDGTKEFVKRNGEFTVNIALITQGQATLGVVYVPVTAVCYLGKVGEGAWKQDGDGQVKAITTKALDSQSLIQVVASRSHRGEEVDRMIGTIEAQLGACEVVSMGSSLKMCLIAEGSADIYPRLAPTCEWDTAAAHAVVSAAGGEIYDTKFKPLRYNQKAQLLNPHFIALADPEYPWQALLG